MLCIADNVGMQVTGIGVENLDLFAGRRDDRWMTMSNVANIVDTIQVGHVRIIIQVLALAFDDFERFVIRQAE